MTYVQVLKQSVVVETGHLLLIIHFLEVNFE